MEAVVVEPFSIEAYRSRHRSGTSRWYSGRLHFASTTLGSLATIALAALQVRNPTASEWLVIPATFLIANTVEYLMHRFPMHHPYGPAIIREIYKRHTLEHHKFFTHDDMVAQSHRDFNAVMFPPSALFLFLGVIGGPIAAAFFLFATRNAGWLYFCTAVGYFLTYEWLHLAYHLPSDGFIGRLPFMSHLRRNHTLHHDLSLMESWNFNITFPILDRLAGTLRR